MEQRLLSGNRAFDRLTEGLQYGIITCISATDTSDLTYIVDRLITRHLASQSSIVTILDTANSFDVRALSQHIKNVDLKHIDLEKVQLIKTFDFQGVVETIAKISADIESQPYRLLVFDKLSQAANIMLRNNRVQGMAVLDAFFRTLTDMCKSKVCIMLLDGFVPDRAYGDCSFDCGEEQPFFDHDKAPLLDLHIHIHTQSGHRVFEVVMDRYAGRRGICVD